MRFKFRVIMSERRLPDVIPEEELESIVQEKYYLPNA